MTRRKARRARIARNKLRRERYTPRQRTTMSEVFAAWREQQRQALADRVVEAISSQLALGVSIEFQAVPSPPFASIKFEHDGGELRLRVVPLGYPEHVEFDVGFAGLPKFGPRE